MGHPERKTQMDEYESIAHGMYSLLNQCRNDPDFASFVQVQDENKLLEGDYRKIMRMLAGLA